MRKILAIDDDDAFLHFVSVTLRRRGCEVVTTSRAGDALSLALTQRPAVVLIDVMTPEINGLDVCRAIRAEPALAATYIILVTADESEETAVAGLEAGRDEFLHKPLSAPIVWARVRSALRHAASLHELDEVNHRLQAQLASRAAAEHLLRQSEQKYRSLVENANVGITLLDTQHRVMMTNATRAKLFGMTVDDLVGRPCYHTCFHRDSPCHDCPGVQALATGRPHEVESQRVREDGTVFDVRILAAPTFADDGSVSGFIEVIVDITDARQSEHRRREAEEALRFSEAKFRKISEAALDAVVMLDSQGKVIHWNPAAEKMFGYREQEILGKEVYDALAPSRHRKLARRGLAADFAANGRGRSAGKLRELVGLRKDGSEFPVEFSLATIELDDRAYAVSVIRDITDRKRSEAELQRSLVALEAANQALQEACEQAETANRAKSQFLANMSHELRTPLHGILSFSAFGTKKIDTAPKADLLRYFQRIDQSGETLLTLVNDLLDLAKLDAGKMRFDFRPVDLSAVLSAIVDEFASIIDHRSMTIRITGNDREVMAIVDPERIAQVFRNLLSNAVKFSPDGSEIEVSLHGNAKTVTVTVSDRGIGIPEDELETIFDEFIQSSKTRTGAGGTGLGLSISREIVIAHQGRIWAANRRGGGAVFVVEIRGYLKPSVAVADRKSKKAPAVGVYHAD